MSVPSYTTDLQLIANADAVLSDPGKWAELTGYTSGGAATAETDFYIQNARCISQSTGTSIRQKAGLQYTHTSNIGASWKAGFCVFMWHVFLAGNAIASWANGGLRVGIGSSSGNMKYWNSLGNDSGRAPYGGWQNTAIDPTYAADQTQGSPINGNYTVFGSLSNIVSAVLRGNPHGVDIIRYGRGILYATAGESGNYATFLGMSIANDATTARWGLLQAQAGTYLAKGVLSLGSDSTSVNFVDSNRAIFFDSVPRTYTDFNRIEIRNASSVINISNCSFASLGSLSKGSLQMHASASVTMSSCTFTDMNLFTFLSSATLTGCTWRRCNTLSLGGASVSSALFDSCYGLYAVDASSSISSLSNSSFKSSGTGHAIRITSGTSHTLSGLTFSGYASSNGSTGNEAVFVDISSGSVTLNIFGGDVPSYRTSGASVTVVASATVTLTGLKEGSEVRAYLGTDPSTSTEIDGIESSSTSFTFSQSYAGQSGYIQILALGYVPITLPISYVWTNISIPIQQNVDRVYYNPV